MSAVERCLADAARYGELPSRDLRALTIALLELRLTTADRVDQEVASGRPNGVRPLRDGVRDFRGGAWSSAEATLRAVLHGRGWRVLFNPRIERLDGTLVGVPDAYLLDHGIAVQVQSRLYHAGVLGAAITDDWAATAEADSRFPEVGITPVAVAPVTLRDRPAAFLARLARTVEASAGRAPPKAVVRPLTGGQISPRVQDAPR